MALTKNHAVPVPYTKGDYPVDPERLRFHLHDEFRKIESAIRRINHLLPQAAVSEPSEKYIGMIRYAIAADWDPLTLGVDTWVYWDGSAWAAL